MRDLSIGKLYNPGKLSYDAGCYFDMSGEKCTLELFWLDVTEKDIENVLHGRATFGLWYSDDSDVFFLFHFADDAWADSAFSIMQMPPARRIRPPRLYGRKRLNLSVMLVDAESGIIKAVRTVSLSAAFSRKLCASVNRQFSEHYIENWSEDGFHGRCHTVYAEYPNSEALSRAPGCIICQAPEC